MKTLLCVLLLSACGTNPLAKTWLRTQPTVEEQAAGVSMVDKVLSLDASGVMTLVATTSFSSTSSRAGCNVADSGAGHFTTLGEQVSFAFTMYNRIVSGCTDQSLNLATTAVPGTDTADFTVDSSLTLVRQANVVDGTSRSEGASSADVVSATEVYSVASH